ncbi:hypothetical protein R69746_05636 [Paraburkholderia aspalathi]|uniref:hypothetical protein n=1 Tax=Paraburkholderia aspalathi TaxID=1324617 RepID=UPI0019091FF2|nr:hypothetical protein [Paraburkholderia aspalathi]MBK3841741.1 hypothetical protein [Paraburkholderia aspalathi]CAE6811380.1 hypothetical protein R69746_05636 [Paraburkholderia aspalathi]
MKLILPVEHRIQQKGEKYADDELIRDAIEVSKLRSELDALRRRYLRLDIYSWCATGAIAIAAWIWLVK